MASSGSFSTSYCTQSGKTWYWDFSWWVTGWSGNTAHIHWEVYNRCTSGSSGSTWIANYGFSGSIAGHDFSSSNNFYKDSCIASGDFDLGGGTWFSAWVSAHPYAASAESYGDGSWTLDNNVITPTVTVSMGNTTETTIACSMSVTHNGYQPIQDNYIDLFTDSGCTNKVGTITGTSGTFTGLNPNTTYYARANASNGYYRGYSGVPSKTTYKYPYCTSAPDFTIGGNVTLKFYNPLKRTIQLQMWSHNSQSFINSTKISATPNDDTNYTFPASDYISNLFNSIPESTSSKYNIDVWYGDNKAVKEGGSYKVGGNNGQAPTFTDFNYKDTDSLASQLTGKNGVNNPGILISGMSNCEFTVTTAQKATSSYGATLDKYNFAWPNAAGAQGTYSSSAAVTGTVSDGNTSSISVSAYDKRGQYKTVSKSITLITPSHATSQLQTDRQNGVNAATYLNGALAFWNGDWANGTSRPNTLLKVEYRVNKTGSYHDITSAVNSNSSSTKDGDFKILALNSNVIQLHANGSSGGFTVGTSYTVEIFVTTGLNTTYKYEDRYKIAELTVTSGIFGMARYKGSDGKYHYGINGLPASNRTFKVNGTLESSGATYVGADGLYIGGVKAIWYA